jgi:hypothetical protein
MSLASGRVRLGSRAGVVVASTAILLVLLGARASADEAAPDKDLKLAKESFEAAQKDFLREDYEKAADKFLGAFGHKPYPAFLFNAAVAFEKAKRFDQAKEYFERYLALDAGANDAAQVKARIDALNKMLAPPPPPAAPPPAAPPPAASPDAGAPPASSGAAGAPATPAAPGAPAVPAAPVAPEPLALPSFDTKGLVVIDSKPQGATIYLNDKTKGPFGKTPWQGSLENKPVRLILESKGFKPEQRQVAPQSDKLVDIYIALSEEHYLGWIEVTSNAVGASVYIDRKDIGAIGRTPFTGHLKPGKHTIYMERQGFVPLEKTIDVKPGTAIQYAWDMEKSKSGWIAITGKGAKGGQLSVDDKPACTVPCRTEVPPGKRKVVVHKEGSEDYEAELEIAQTTETSVDVQFWPNPPKTRAISTALTAALILGGGIYVGHLAEKTKDDINADIRAGMHIDSSDPRFLRGKLEAIGADVLFVFGAIVGISAVVTVLSHGPPGTGNVDQKALGFAPTAGPDGGGLSAFGRF